MRLISSVSGPWPDTDASTTRGFLPLALPHARWRDGPSRRLCASIWMLHATKYNSSKVINNILARRVEIATLSAFLSRFNDKILSIVANKNMTSIGGVSERLPRHLSRIAIAATQSMA